MGDQHLRLEQSKVQRLFLLREVGYKLLVAEVGRPYQIIIK